MREIKFRAWDKETKELCYDFLDRNWLLVSVKSPFVELMQYTGLKDKKGKEIYEGDIVKQEYHKVTGSYDDYEVFDGHHLGKVVITANKGVCMYKPLCYSEETDETQRSNQYKTVAGYRCEVIGNIYANADLLELAQSAIEPNELPST